MVTKLWLCDKASPDNTYYVAGNGNYTLRQTVVTPSPGTDADVTRAALATGPATLQLQVWEASVPGLVNGVFLSRPLQAVTISGTITFNLYGYEEQMTANAGLRVVVDRCDGSGNFISQIVASNKGTELGTGSTAVQNWTASPTSTTLAAGDRIRVTVYTVDAGGTMAASGTVHVTIGGTTTGAGGNDTWVQFTENFTEILGNFTDTVSLAGTSGLAQAGGLDYAGAVAAGAASGLTTTRAYAAGPSLSLPVTSAQAQATQLAAVATAPLAATSALTEAGTFLGSATATLAAASGLATAGSRLFSGATTLAPSGSALAAAASGSFLGAAALLASAAYATAGQPPSLNTLGVVGFPTYLDDQVSLLNTANDATAALAGPITGTPTTFSVTTGGGVGYPSGPHAVSIEDEILYVSNRLGDSFTIGARGADGTVSADHAAGVSVDLRVISAHHMLVRDALIATQTKLGNTDTKPTLGTFLKGSGSGTSGWGALLTSDITSALGYTPYNRPTGGDSTTFLRGDNTWSRVLSGTLTGVASQPAYALRVGSDIHAGSSFVALYGLAVEPIYTIGAFTNVLGYAVMANCSGATGLAESYGLYAYADGGAVNWAVFADGDTRVTGTLRADGHVGLNAAPITNAQVEMVPDVTASGGWAAALDITPPGTLHAAANGDNLYGLWCGPTFDRGTFATVSVQAAHLDATAPAGTAVATGVYARASGAATNWAGYFGGDVRVESGLNVGTTTSGAAVGQVKAQQSCLFGSGDFAFWDGGAVGSSAGGVRTASGNLYLRMGSGNLMTFEDRWGSLAASVDNSGLFRSWSANIGDTMTTSYGELTVSTRLRASANWTKLANEAIAGEYYASDTTPANLATPTYIVANVNPTANNYAGVAFASMDSSSTERIGAMIAGVFVGRGAAALDGELSFLTRDMTTGGGVKEALRLYKSGNAGVPYSLNVAGGVNVGSATGAGAGSVYTSAYMQASVANSDFFKGVSPANMAAWMRITQGTKNALIGMENDSGVNFMGSGFANALAIATQHAGAICFHTNNVTSPRMVIDGSTGAVTIGNGINVGSASGAATGEVRASGPLQVGYGGTGGYLNVRSNGSITNLYHVPDAGVDLKYWRQYVDASQWTIRTVNDALTSAVDALRISRVGNAGTGIQAANAWVGWYTGGDSSYAHFGHATVAGSAGGYALLQSSGGATYLNAASGQVINFGNNNSYIGNWSATVLSVFGGLNLGSASGAATGELRASGKLYPNSVDTSASCYTAAKRYTIAANSTQTVSGDLGTSGLYLLRDVSTNAFALYWAVPGAATVEIHDSAGVWQNSAPADNSSLNGFYLSGSANLIKNAYAASHTYDVIHLEL